MGELIEKLIKEKQESYRKGKQTTKDFMTYIIECLECDCRQELQDIQEDKENYINKNWSFDKEELEYWETTKEKHYERAKEITEKTEKELQIKIECYHELATIVKEL